MREEDEQTRHLPPDFGDPDETIQMPPAQGGHDIEQTQVLGAESEDRTTIRPLARAYLLCISGPMAGRKFNVKVDVTKIGRDRNQNHVVLESDRRASRRQATILARGGRYVIYDKRSRNRTFVNRCRLAEEEELALNFGDEIEAGSSVFRFVREGQWDWRPPAKAGSFWARRGPLVLLLVSVVLVLGAGYAALKAFQYVTMAGERPGTLGISAGATKQLSLPATGLAERYNHSSALVRVPDRPGCGIAIADVDGRLTLVDGNGLGVIWQWEGERIDPSQAIASADLNNDGCDEIICVTAGGAAVALNGRTGVLLWESGFLSKGLLSPAVADLDGDGLDDVVVAGTDGAVYIRTSVNGQFRALRPPSVGEDIVAPPVVSDLDGDGVREIVIMNTSGEATVIDGRSEAEEARRAYPSDDAVFSQSAFMGRPVLYSSPAIAEVPGSKTRRMVFCSSHRGLVVMTDGDPARLIWARWLQADSTYFYRQMPLHYPSPVMADMTGDGNPDVVLATVFGQVVVLDGASKETAWTYFNDAEWDAVWASPALYDFDKDGCPEVVFGDNRGGVHVVSGRRGVRLGGIPADGNAIHCTPLIGDVDGNGYVDVVVQNEAGLFRLATSNSSTPEEQTFWAMSGGTPGREGTVTFSGFRVEQNRAILLVCLVLAFVLVTLNTILLLVRAGRRRRLERMVAD